MNGHVRLSIEADKITFWDIENGKILDSQSFKKTATKKLFNHFKIKLKHIVTTTNSKLYLITKSTL